MMWRRTFTPVTKLVIVIMRTNDGNNSYDQEEGLKLNEELFEHKKNKSKTENKYRGKGMMMFYIAMEKGIRTHCKCQSDHAPFKNRIVDDIDPENGKGAHEYRQ